MLQLSLFALQSTTGSDGPESTTPLEPPASGVAAPLEEVDMPPLVVLLDEEVELCAPPVEDDELLPLLDVAPLPVEAVWVPASAGSIESRLTIDAHAAHAMNATPTAAWPQDRRIARE